MKTPKLLTLDYYVDKVSLAMQNDAIFMQQIADFVAVMNNFDSEINEFKYALNALSYDVINDNVVVDDYIYSDLLDKIASIFNISRHFIIDFKNPLTNQIDPDMETNLEMFTQFNENVANNTLSLTIDLTDNQMRCLIFCAIMKNSYDGSSLMITKTYDTVIKFMSLDIPTAQGWKIYQCTKYTLDAHGDYIADPASTDCLMTYSSDYVFDNASRIKSQYFTLFFAGLLTIHSAGICYYNQTTDVASLLYWCDETDDPSSIIDKYKWSVEDNDPSTKRRWL